jgi:methylmalonyl-CoA/ethylmalonyl-CoA epimerase
MIRKINHIAIAVPDIDAAARFYVDQLGLELSGRETVAGDTRIELVQPDSPDSPIAKFIEQRGPGLQHLCFEVDDIEAEVERLKTAGVRLINDTPIPGAHGCRVAFVHPKATGGVLVELSQPPR